MKPLHKLNIIILFWFCSSCSKIVSIDPPVNTIVSEEAFSNNHNANSSVIGIYSKLINQSAVVAFGNGAFSMLNGISSDEITFIGGDPNFDPFFHNQILSDNNLIFSSLWQQPYGIIYQANACLEQLAGNKKVTSPLREQLMGEAKFVRALVYFYLINSFGDVPFLTTTDYKANTVAPRVSQDTIYSNLISDLEGSLNSLPGDFSGYNNERIRATKWAAMALLSRIYLYTGNWGKASQYADQVINSGYFSLLSDLNSVFLKNSNEAIFQLYIDGTISPFNTLPESYLTIPPDHTSLVYFWFPTSFMDEFDSDDLRRTAWVDSTNYSGTVYYYPSKYKIGPTQQAPNSVATEYYMVLRLAEQYLISAEAKAQQGDLTGSASDLNMVRARAGLGPSVFSSKDDAINNILAERKKELFYEWGHRWFDLKRTGKVDSIMNTAAQQKGGSWKPTAKVFPIPAAEIFRNPNLTQNPGY